MPEIFSYTDYRVFIKDACEEIKKAKPFFSYRYIAQKTGLKSVGFISWVIKGKRTISVSLAHRIAAVLKLGKRESDYFELLVCHNQAQTPEERQHYLERLTTFRSTRAAVVERDRDQYYSRWYYSAVRELISLADISDAAEIVAMLRPSIKRSEAKGAIELLERLGMIRKKKSGIYERIDSSMTSGKSVPPAVIHGFQIATMQLAQSALHRFDKEDRDISTITLSCNERDEKRIQERVRQMRAEIIEIACASKGADRVFQVNTQFFPLSCRVPGSRS